MDDKPIHKKRYIKRFSLGLGLLVIILVMGFVFFWRYLPYHVTVAHQISKTLESYGLDVQSLEVESLTKSDVVLHDIQLGTDPGFSIGNVKAAYSLPRLRDLKVHEIEAEQVKAHIYLKDKKLVVSGLEALMASKPASDTPPLIFDTKALEDILPQLLHVTDMALTGKDMHWSFETALNGTLSSRPAPELHATSKKLAAAFNDIQLTANTLYIKAILNEEKKRWDATFSAKEMILAGIDFPIPAVHVTADASLTADKVIANIRASNNEKTYGADVTISIPLDNPRSGSLAVKQIKFPWGGGMIALKPVTIPLTFRKPLSLSIQLEKVDLSQLLAKLGEGKINGTGQISGVLPITYYPDGRITLQEGKAQALQAGTISVSPSLLPGENEQVQVARATLENFHYTTLKISVSSTKDQRSTIHLTLEGNNPDAFGGRPVKLNVNLSGDVLPLLQQSVLPINNLKQLLELQDSP